MARHETATLAGGCFWCLEAAFQDLKGVERVQSGYAGDRGAAERARLGRPHRHGAEAARVVLSGRGVSSRLLPSQPEPGLLQRRDRAQSGEGAQDLPRQVEAAGGVRLAAQGLGLVGLLVAPLALGAQASPPRLIRDARAQVAARNLDS